MLPDLDGFIFVFQDFLSQACPTVGAGPLQRHHQRHFQPVKFLLPGKEMPISGLPTPHLVKERLLPEVPEQLSISCNSNKQQTDNN